MSQQRIAVVGAGIVGLSTAYALLKQGMKRVTVLEQMVVDHPRSMSRGISRLLRFEYGSDLFYSTMVRLSLKCWYELEKVARRPIFTRTGVLVLGREHDNETLASYRTLRDLGIAIERFPRGNCAHRFPQFNVEPYDVFTYSRDGGILHASTCLQTLKDLVRTLGGEIVENCRVTQIRHDDLRHPIRLQLSSGGECLAEKVV
ncbi:MAG: FAD-dependent oxidoreductase, partial [Ktedonobacteraceae bacterium]|nr:FAD-dependent oxidoreductase [Ktedonobacteraceae bacterium]